VSHPTRWIALGVALVVVVVGVVLATQVGGDPRADATRSQLVGAAAPRFDVRPLEGGTLTRADLAGRAVIVNFWNTWCAPCHAEQPALERFWARHRDDPNVAFVGIVRDDTERAVREFVAEEGIDWTIATDPDAKAALDFGTRGQPETFAITPDGVIAGAQIGPSSVEDLETLLAAAQGVRR
jgi:cytochrome c biogenesis protein CcmG, thiol:disulfide interchange protein DsbE